MIDFSILVQLYYTFCMFLFKIVHNLADCRTFLFEKFWRSVVSFKWTPLIFILYSVEFVLCWNSLM